MYKVKVIKKCGELAYYWSSDAEDALWATKEEAEEAAAAEQEMIDAYQNCGYTAFQNYDKAVVEKV